MTGGAASRVRGEAASVLLRAVEALPFYLEWKRFLGFPRGRPAAPWVNAVLQDRQEWAVALEQVRRLGLPPHHDPPKNWDSLAAVSQILLETGSGGKVLDAGATLASVVLPWLCLYGYRDLWGINLSFRRPKHRGPIRYERGDVTRTRFAPGTFDAVTCMSVIEHGVEVGAYFREVSRILKPGGLLLTSTDYWIDPIATEGKVAFGAPIHVFSRPEIEGMVRTGAKYGLRLTSEIDLRCRERAVSWKSFGLEYTFVLLCMRKET